MPKRSLRRWTTAVCLTVAGCSTGASARHRAGAATPPALNVTPQPQAIPGAAAPASMDQAEPAAPLVSQTPTTTAATLPGTEPALPATLTTKPSMSATTGPAGVITAPASKPSSASDSQSYTAGALPQTAATSPTSRPTTAPMVSASPFSPAPPSTQPAAKAADAQLAERFCSLAQASIPLKVKNNDQWPGIWKQSGALLAAAVKLDPTQGRFARLLADVCLQQHDVRGAIDALTKARSPKADPNDQFAQTEVIDLYVDQMQTAGDKIAYLKDLLGRPAIAESVRSHAGVSCAKLMLDRGQPDTARNVLAEALRLNPYNSAGLRLRYDMLPPEASNFERCSALMAILRANPAQPAIAATLADRLASVGIVEDSIPWYDLASRLYDRQNQPNLDLALNYACEMFIAGQNGTATNLDDQLCAVSPYASGNWYLKILLARARGNDTEIQKAIDQSINALSNSLVLQLPHGKDQPAPTTRPVDATGPFPMPDLAKAVESLPKDDGNASVDTRRGVQIALADLATLQVYFAKKTGDAAPTIAALRALSPDDPALHRLDGYSALYNGKADDANAAFEKCVGKDPLGEMGLVRVRALNANDQQAAALAGRTLLNQHPSGLLGAFLLDGMRDLKVEIIPSREVDALKTQVQQFPTSWLRIIDSPQNFYAMRAEPIALARNYGEPLLAKLTVLNLSSAPLPLGPDGVIKPDLWFSARVRGLAEQQYGSIAYDRLAGPLLLAPGQVLTQTIRLDQGPLQQLLDNNFAETIEVTGDAISNPQPIGNGQVVPGPAGYRVVFAHPFSRSAEPMNSKEAQKSLALLGAGSPEDKFASIDLVGAYLRAISASPHSDDASLRQTTNVLEDALRKAADDPTPAVSAWAAMASLAATPSADHEQKLTDLSQDPDWRHRQVALVESAAQNNEIQSRIAKSLAADPEPSVRQAAEARLLLLANP